VIADQRNLPLIDGVLFPSFSQPIPPPNRTRRNPSSRKKESKTPTREPKIAVPSFCTHPDAAQIYTKFSREMEDAMDKIVKFQAPSPLAL